MSQFFMDPQGRVVDATGTPVQVPPGLMPVPAPQAPVPQSPQSQGWLARDVAGVPLWGVLLGLGGVVAGGYYVVTRMRAGASEDSSASTATSAVVANPSSTPAKKSRSRWAPSRAGVTERMQKWLTQRNKTEGLTVFADADEAMKKGMKNPSPLVNVRVKRNAKLHEDADFKKWARREGLNVVRIDPTTVGLVPAEDTKRGGQWESYVDALREEGQKA